MMDAANVVTHAIDGHVKEFAERREISLSRAYEMLGDQCQYGKAKRLMRDIIEVNPASLDLFRADMDTFFASFEPEQKGPVTNAEMNKELHEAVQAELEHQPKAVRLQENREAIVVLAKKNAEIEREDLPQVRVEMREAVADARVRRNGK